MAPTTISRPNRPRGAARRTALLDATLELVGELGTDAVTHRAVARRADLPLASTTYWFDSKEQLLTEALRHAADRDTVRLREAAATALARTAAEDGGGGDLSDRSGRGKERDRAPIPIDAIIGVVLGTDAGPTQSTDRTVLLATYTLMLEAARRPALQAIAEAWTESYLTTIGELLRRAGSTRPADDSRLLIAATDGLLLDRLATGAPTSDDPAPELRRLLAALLGATR